MFKDIGNEMKLRLRISNCRESWGRWQKIRNATPSVWTNSRNLTYRTQVQFSQHLKKASPTSGPSILEMTHVHPSPHLQITYPCQSSLRLSQTCSNRSHHYTNSNAIYYCIILCLNNYLTITKTYTLVDVAFGLAYLPLILFI